MLLWLSNKFLKPREGIRAVAGGQVVSRDYSFNSLQLISGVERTIHSSLLPTNESTVHSFEFEYDELQRLTKSTFSNTSGSHVQQMSYNKAGGILTKASSVTGQSGVIDASLSYSNAYTYDSGLPHQISYITGIDDQIVPTYNSEGSIIEIETQTDPRNPDPHLIEKFRWNDERMLVADSNAAGIHHYIYDYNGERILKSSFLNSTVWVNDTIVDVQTELTPYQLYVNPQIVVRLLADSDIETYHYYMGMTRVMTDLYTIAALQGPMKTSQGGSEESPATEDLKTLLGSFGMIEGLHYSDSDLDANRKLSDDFPQYQPSSSKSGSNPVCCNVSGSFWYHPDYLGSVDIVTNPSGEVEQFFLYNPWGEQMYRYDNPSATFDSPYRFNGKELDEETGLAYYGARYYDNQLSMWLSVDPLAMDASNVSKTPYHFSSNNPVMRIDPDGMNDYTIDSDGNILLARETDDDFDQLYTLDDYNEGNLDNGIKVNDQNILADLLKVESKGKTSEGEERLYSSSVVGESSQKDIYNVFKFAADNTNVEWSAFRANVDGEEQFGLTTYRVTVHTPGSRYTGISYEEVVAIIHNHPGSNDGYSGEPGTMYSDVQKARGYIIENRRATPLNYVYMSDSKRLWSINRNTGLPAYIRTIGKLSDLFFGTLNSQ